MLLYAGILIQRCSFHEWSFTTGTTLSKPPMNFSHPCLTYIYHLPHHLHTPISHISSHTPFHLNFIFLLHISNSWNGGTKYEFISKGGVDPNKFLTRMTTAPVCRTVRLTEELRKVSSFPALYRSPAWHVSGVEPTI